MKGVVIGATICGALAGCRPKPPLQPTPYQPFSKGLDEEDVDDDDYDIGYGGYYSSDLGAGLWEITVRGNKLTSYGSVLGYAYRRSNEVCSYGFDVVRDVNGTRSATVTATEGGATNIYGTTIVRAQSETTTQYGRPSVTLIVRCRPPTSGPPGGLLSR